MMQIFRFGEDAGHNGKTTTFNGNVALYHDYPTKTHCSVEITGPHGGERARMIIDKATAGKLGAALLKWAGTKEQGICPVCLEPIKFNALPKLGGPVMFSCGCTDPTTGTPEAGYHPGSLADPRD